MLPHATMRWKLKYTIEEESNFNTINRLDTFIDKISAVILDILSTEIDEFNDLNEFFGGTTEDEKWIFEQEKMFIEFLNSLSSVEYQHYFAVQEEAQRVFWELEMVS